MTPRAKPCWPVGGEILGAPSNLWGLHCVHSALLIMGAGLGAEVSAGGGADPWLPQSWGQEQVCRGSAHVLGEGCCPRSVSEAGEKSTPRPYLLGWAVWRDSGVPAQRLKGLGLIWGPKQEASAFVEPGWGGAWSWAWTEE